MQTIDDGKRDILLANGALHRAVPERAQMPVMLLRLADQRVRRGGWNAALMQLEQPVAERGGLHGALNLDTGDAPVRLETSAEWRGRLRWRRMEKWR